jgi:hypothetical protein
VYVYRLSRDLRFVCSPDSDVCPSRDFGSLDSDDFCPSRDLYAVSGVSVSTSNSGIYAEYSVLDPPLSSSDSKWNLTSRRVLTVRAVSSHSKYPVENGSIPRNLPGVPRGSSVRGFVEMIHIVHRAPNGTKFERVGRRLNHNSCGVVKGGRDLCGTT